MLAGLLLLGGKMPMNIFMFIFVFMLVLTQLIYKDVRILGIYKMAYDMTLHMCVYIYIFYKLNDYRKFTKKMTSQLQVKPN